MPCRKSRWWWRGAHASRVWPKDRLGLKSLPEEDKGRYHTLSGLVMWLSGKLPQTGDVLTWENWRLEVVDLDGRRIDKILATPIAPAEATQPDIPDGQA